MSNEERRLSGLTATFLVVASMVGTGVFTTSGLLLADLRSAPAVLLAWGLGGLLAMQRHQQSLLAARARARAARSHRARAPASLRARRGIPAG